MDFSSCLNDDTIGPAVQGCRDDFDFTIKFEKIFLSIIPAAFFTAISLPRIIYLSRRPALVGGTLLRNTKIAAIGAYSALHLSLLALSCTKSHKLSALFISAAAVTFASSLVVAGLSLLEHSRSPRPSIILVAYLFLSILFDVTETRTLWLVSSNLDEVTFSRLFTASVVAKAAIILLESRHKTRWLKWDVKEHSPEEMVGLFGLGAFVWLNRLFWTGYKKVLTIRDLFALDRNMTTEALHLRLAEQLTRGYTSGQNYGLAKALAKTLAIPLLLPVGPRIALSAFQFCQPFLINTVLDYLEVPADDSRRNISYGLIGATILVYSGIAASNAFYWYFQERAMYMARGALAGAVYKKTTEAKLSVADDSAALTLMSTDVERIRTGFLRMHEFWANTIEIALASWLLERQLGLSVVAPLAVVLCCVLGSAFLSRFTGPRQKAWMERIQKRVGLTANVITHMKHLRISGLTAPVEKLIQNLRVTELKVGSKFRMVQTWSAVIAFTPMAVSPVITFAITSRTLDVNTIFTSYSYLLLLSAPLTTLFQTVPSLLAAFTCLARIQSFIDKDARVDFRESAFGLPDEKHCSENAEMGQNESKRGSAMTIAGGNFGWEEGRFNLRGIDLSIPASRLTMVVGPVASGKSTLCKVLLGETPITQGRVAFSAASRRVGYCDQVPHLTNATIRENIIGFAPFNSQRYNEVVEATALEPDLAMLPQGDQTKVGSKGITLSGGQKQRVSMARSLYLDSHFFVFDDILSGLDADTEDEVFNRVFGTDGLLRRRNATTVLCTHSVRHLPSADHVVALDTDGSIVEQGTFGDLIANQKYVHGLGIKSNIDHEARSGGYSGSAVTKEPTREELARALTTQSTASSHVSDEGRIMGDRTVYRHYFQTLGTLPTVAMAVFGGAWAFLYNWNNIWLKLWSEGISSTPPTHSNAFYIGFYALFQASNLVCIYVVCVITFKLMIQVSGAKLHKAALRTVISAPLRFFTTTDAGIVTNLFSQDMTLIDGELPNALMNLVLDLTSTVGMAAVIATASPYLAITYPFLAAIMYGIQRFYLRTSRQLRLLDLEAKSPLYTHFLDTIQGVATFRAFGWVQDGIDLNNRLVDTSQRPAYLLAMIQRWLGFTLQCVVAVLAIVVVTLATQMRANTAFTGASLITLMNFGDSLTYIVTCYTILETSIGAVSRLKSFSEKVRPEDLEGEDFIPPPEWPVHGAIEIKNVSASYGDVDERTRESTSSSGSSRAPRNLAINNLSLRIAPGEKVAICGRSGSGKSSTILLLLRILDPLTPNSTNITIDSTPLHTVDRSTLRERVIAVPQDPVFLPDGTSFRDNLDPFGTAALSDCESVLCAVELWHFVQDRGGLEAGLAADSLSQGQKQLFSLARAILRRRLRSRGKEEKVGGILLLDEVSSSVDQETDRAMQRIILDEFAGYTIIMVSHRLDMVMGFDTVVVMDAGRAVEIGSPRVLVESEGSRFKELWLVGNKG